MEVKKVLKSLAPDLPDADMMFHSAKRGNTSVKFLDDRTIKVHRAKGEKDDIETALAYAISIHLLGSRSALKKLATLVKEID